VPFQEIDVYAKESGYVQKLNVDYGSHVKHGQVMATLEIPELLAQLNEDEAEVKNANNQVSRAANELKRDEAKYNALHLEYTRLNTVFQTQPGIVAQQEVDDSQGKDLAAASQVDAGKAALEAAQSDLVRAKARLARDQTLYDYSKIVAPFSGVVTQRYANLGALVQAGTTSSTQAMPIVRLSQDDLFRLVIPVPESYVRYIKVGDPVSVRVPSLNRSFPGKVTRFSVDVRQDTRTMHTEVDVQNRVNLALPQLPSSVQSQGIQVQKKSSAFMMVIAIYSPTNRYDATYIANYANIYVLDALKRIPGANQSSIFGTPDYAMRIWLKPDRMAQLGITAGDVHFGTVASAKAD